jgi:acid stress-induced BolA-like protein IbaG/YrbA
MIHRDEIKKLIEEGLPGSQVSVSGEDGAHFEAIVISPAFEGKNMLAQHRLVYETLGGRVQSGEIHALSLRTYTLSEWEAKQD